jgi:hypothetical protein
LKKRAVEQSLPNQQYGIYRRSRKWKLVEATDFLLRDALQVSTTLQNSKQGSYTIDATRSAMYSVPKLSSKYRIRNDCYFCK